MISFDVFPTPFLFVSNVDSELSVFTNVGGDSVYWISISINHDTESCKSLTITIFAAAQELVPLRYLFLELVPDVKGTPMVVFEDNTSTIGC
jgi:hypothetical protein